MLKKFQHDSDVAKVPIFDYGLWSLKHLDRVKELEFVLVINADKPPWILTRYRYNQNLIKGLTNESLFKPPVEAGRLL